MGFRAAAAEAFPVAARHLCHLVGRHRVHIGQPEIPWQLAEKVPLAVGGISSERALLRHPDYDRPVIDAGVH
jgi:hypothetical protein